MKSLLLSLAAGAARWLPAWFKRALYRSRALSGFIRRALNRAAPGGLAQVTVAAGGLQGAQLLLDLHAEKDYWLGTYEPELQQAVADWLKPGMLIYDVGANIGYISLLLARAAGQSGRVVAFEALPANIQRLRANLALNPRAQVTALHAAVIDSTRPVTFYTHASGSMGKAAGSAGREDQSYPSSITVEGLALDDYVYAQGNPPPQAVKMDIEGGEVLALQGMARLLRQAKPVLLIELHGEQAASAAWQALGAAGYAVRRMQKGYPQVASLDELDWKAYIVAVSR
jgi:FkbM family methyltransferase